MSGLASAEAARQTGWQVRPLIIVLHTTAEAVSAQRLIRAWAPRMPAGRFVPLPVTPHDVQAANGQLQALMRGSASKSAPGSAHAIPAHTILAGVCGAADLALRVGFERDARAYAGLLACGPRPLPLSPLTGSGVSHGTAKLRLIWTARDASQSSAALGELLRCLRATGLDAQGAVLDGPDGGSTDADEDCTQAESLVRLSGAYLAELVASTLGSSRDRAAPATDGGISV